MANISPSKYSLLYSAFRSISRYCSGVRNVLASVDISALSEPPYQTRAHASSLPVGIPAGRTPFPLRLKLVASVRERFLGSIGALGLSVQIHSQPKDVVRQQDGGQARAHRQQRPPPAPTSLN